MPRENNNLLMLTLGGWGLFCVAIIVTMPGMFFARSLAMVAILLVLASVFSIYMRSKGRFQIFEISIFMTWAMALQFGIVPMLVLAADGTDTADEIMVKALELVVAGMISFWIGCILIVDRKSRDAGFTYRGTAQKGNVRIRWATLLYAIAFLCKVYLFRRGMFGYGGSLDAYNANLAQAQVLNAVAQLGTLALIILAIEVFGRGFKGQAAQLFGLVFAAEIFWGLLSGMKGFTLLNFLLIASVASVTSGRLQKRWLAMALFFLVAIYPINNAYRNAILRTGGVTSISDLVVSSGEALSGAREDTGERGWFALGGHSALGRLNSLSSVQGILSLSDPSAIQGDEKLWMIPIYQFVPRFIWKTKPILNKGQRFSAATGGTETSSTGTTLIGDWYVWGGFLGELLGMFTIGAIAQKVSNLIRRASDERTVFFYVAMLFPIVNTEGDAFSFLTTIIKLTLYFILLSKVLYGGKWFSVYVSVGSAKVARPSLRRGWVRV